VSRQDNDPRRAVRQVVAAAVGVDYADVVPDDRLIDDLGIDSLRGMEILIGLEARGLAVDIEEFPRATTVGDLMAIVQDGVGDEEVEQTATAGRQPAQPPSWTGRHVSLEPLRSEHIGFLYYLSTNSDSGYRWRYRGTVPAYEVFEASVWINTMAQFVVVRRQSNELIGHVVCYNGNIASGFGYIGAVFAPQYIGSGVPIEAVALFVRYLFCTWDLRKLYMEVPEFNMDAIATGVDRLFREEGRLRAHEYYNGRHWDAHILAIYREDQVSLLDLAGLQEGAPAG
jgi:RimJ/RimL family protein N-acetyltransferase/acyl carrier protein